MKKIVQEGPSKADTIKGKQNNFTRRWMITKGSSCGATEVEARKFREMVDGSLV